MVFTKLRAQDPHMFWWLDTMACIGGAGAKVKYGAPFFHWLNDQILMIEDYAYVGTEFRGDPDLPLLVDAQWGDIDRKTSQDVDYFLYFSCFYHFY